MRPSREMTSLSRKSGHMALKKVHSVDKDRERRRCCPRCSIFHSLLAFLFLWQLMFWSNQHLLWPSRHPCTTTASDKLHDFDILFGQEFTVDTANASAPLLVVHTYHGLSNRIRALASAMAIAHATGRQLQVLWIPDEHLQATFHDLFENNFEVFDSEEAITGRKDWSDYDKYNYMENEEGGEKYMYIDDTSPRHIYVKSAYVLKSKYAEPDEIARQFNSLVPTRDVRRYLEPFRSQVCRGWAPCSTYIGVHVRHVDPHKELKRPAEDMYTEEGWRTASDWRKMSNPDYFVSELRRILKKQDSLQIFVSTDSEDAMVPFVREFGNRVLYVDKKGCYDRSPKCIKLALADLLLLGHSSHEFILGSFWSSFTEVASYAKRLKVRYAGVDFVSPGKHPHMCGIPKLEKSPCLNGVSIVSAAKDRHDALQKTIPTWLRDESVSEVVLVDWGSNPPLRDVLRINDTRLRIIQVEGATSWVLTRAFNIAFRHTSACRVLKLDSDTELYEGVIKAHPLQQGKNYAGNWKEAKTENDRHLNGIFYAHRNDLAKINGFDERIETYGWDDEDIYNRLAKNGVKRRDLDNSYFHHVEHEDAERMIHSRGVSKFTDVEMLRNKYLLQTLPPWNKDFNMTKLRCQEKEELTCHCSIEKPPLGLVDYHTKQFIENVTLTAYREVVGYTGGFKPNMLQQVTSLAWYEAYLQRNFHTSEKFIVVKPIGTLGERIVGLECALGLAKSWGWSVQIVWTPEDACNHSFKSLFGTTTFGDVIPQFYDFEITWNCKGIYLDHGTDWVSEKSQPLRGQHMILVTRGPFGKCSGAVSDNLWNFLQPTALAKSLRSSLLPLPFTQMFIVKLEGTITQRLFGMASTMELGRRFNRHIAFVWDSKSMGGLKVSDLFDNNLHVVESVEEIFQGKKASENPIYFHNVTGSIDGIEWGEPEHIVVELRGKIAGEGTEEDYNSMIQHLSPTQELLDEMFGLQVGKRFHGMVIGKQWDGCHKEGAVNALKSAYAEMKLNGSAYLFVFAESEGICREAGEGIICVAMCGTKLTKPCLMRHVAAMFVLSKLPYFFFLDWRHQEAQFAMRRGTLKSRRVICKRGLSTSVSKGLADALGAKKLAKRRERKEDTCEGSWHLLMQLAILEELTEEHKMRNGEYWDTLRRNLEHSEVKNLHIFTESAEDEDLIRSHIVADPCNKLKFVYLGRRLRYNDTFSYANVHLVGKLSAVLNADVYLGEGFRNIDPEVHLPTNRVLALSRFEKREGAKCGYSICYRYRNELDGFLSHDTFLFKAPMPQSLITKTGFYQQLGSENVLIHAMKEVGLTVRNPCRSMKTYHNHCSGIRLWQSQDSSSRSWESMQMGERLDMKVCGTVHCEDGWVTQGPEVLEDLE